MSFVLNGGKFKLYTVLNDLIFPTPTQPRISFERAIEHNTRVAYKILSNNCNNCKYINANVTQQ
jgi:hypothetical protein